jgi:hypothetical protein
MIIIIIIIMIMIIIFLCSYSDSSIINVMIILHSIHWSLRSPWVAPTSDTAKSEADLSMVPVP